MNEELLYKKIFKCRTVGIVKKGTGNLLVMKKFNGNRYKKYDNNTYSYRNIIKTYRILFELLKIDVVVRGHLNLNRNKIIYVIRKILKRIKNRNILIKRETYEINDTTLEQKLVKKRFSCDKFFFILFFALCALFIAFYYDYHIIREKINNESISHYKEIEREFYSNRCDTKGHLPALKATCEKFKINMDIQKKVKIAIKI